jgi:hypothetical protein
MRANPDVLRQARDPGRRQQMPRTTSSICTPSADAAYSSVDRCTGSTRLFIFMMMRPVPAGAAISASISSTTGPQRVRGHQQSAVLDVAAVAGEIVEELGEVGADRGRR